LAETLEMQGRSAEAEAEFREVVEARTRILGADDPATEHARTALTGLLEHRNEPSDEQAVATPPPIESAGPPGEPFDDPPNDRVVRPGNAVGDPQSTMPPSTETARRPGEPSS